MMLTLVIANAADIEAVAGGCARCGHPGAVAVRVGSGVGADDRLAGDQLALEVRVGGVDTRVEDRDDRAAGRVDRPVGWSQPIFASDHGPRSRVVRRAGHGSRAVRLDAEHAGLALSLPRTLSRTVSGIGCPHLEAGDGVLGRRPCGGHGGALAVLVDALREVRMYSVEGPVSSAGAAGGSAVGASVGAGSGSGATAGSDAGGAWGRGETGCSVGAGRGWMTGSSVGGGAGSGRPVLGRRRLGAGVLVVLGDRRRGASSDATRANVSTATRVIRSSVAACGVRVQRLAMVSRTTRCYADRPFPTPP